MEHSEERKHTLMVVFAMSPVEQQGLHKNFC